MNEPFRMLDFMTDKTPTVTDTGTHMKTTWGRIYTPQIQEQMSKTNEQELLKMIEPIKASINQLIVKVDAIGFKQSKYHSDLMNLESQFNDLKAVSVDTPEDGADLNIVQWDYMLWKSDPEAWQPVTRDGTYVYELRTFETLLEPYELAGVVSGEIEQFGRDGAWFTGKMHGNFDITHMRRLT